MNRYGFPDWIRRPSGHPIKLILKRNEQDFTPVDFSEVSPINPFIFGGVNQDGRLLRLLWLFGVKCQVLGITNRDADT